MHSAASCDLFSCTNVPRSPGCPHGRDLKTVGGLRGVQRRAMRSPACCILFCVRTPPTGTKTGHTKNCNFVRGFLPLPKPPIQCREFPQLCCTVRGFQSLHVSLSYKPLLCDQEMRIIAALSGLLLLLLLTLARQSKSKLPKSTFPHGRLGCFAFTTNPLRVVVKAKAIALDVSFYLFLSNLFKPEASWMSF
jgi:hypothetical protein